MDCFAEPVTGRRFAPTRWLAMTECNDGVKVATQLPILTKVKNND